MEEEEQFERQTSGRMASMRERNVSSQGGVALVRRLVGGEERERERETQIAEWWLWGHAMGMKQERD